MLVDPKWQRQLDAIGKPRTTGEILLRGADNIERQGWCGEGARNPAGGVCLIVALTDAWRGIRDCDDDRLHWAAVDQLEKYLGMCPIHWNENVCRSKEQAVAALRGAAFAKGK